MNTTIKTAADFRMQLETNLRIHAIATREDVHRLRRKIAFDRYLARIFSQDPSSYFLKGGYAMELRLDRARTTKDIDLTCLKRESDSTDPMSEIILQDLQRFARIDLSDYFSFQIGRPRRDIENAPYGGATYNVSVLINNLPFIEFHLDVGCDFGIDPVEKIQGNNLLEIYGISPPIISVISIPQQFAEKVHSYTFPWEYPNTRDKDLIDLLLLMQQKELQPEIFQLSLRRVFRARNTHLIPETLPQPPVSWEKPFAIKAAECGINLSLEESFLKVSKFFRSIQEA